ncbi:Bgt-2661 [Blumeria graminis f. sp. tritici]|uniref:Bgt-2661 n=2 Tax=Blumeria graminis f. sp. tritici TaxID=62690 RepID=A0A381LI59_BLUGR|nr:hypothetical protein BGT96224_2661 [Blumeria graminis f. sp. tritici 96224]VDB92788.1 Bgt-2661 [Blumeria graminis f. sp. tritici]
MKQYDGEDTYPANENYVLRKFGSFSSKYQDYNGSRISITDIRQDRAEKGFRDMIMKGLRNHRAKTLPTLLLYDENGLQLFEKIKILEHSAHEISSQIANGSIVLELGSGNLRKVGILLQTLNNAKKNIDYYALDLSQKELDRTLRQIPLFEHVKCHGLYGTYDDALQWLMKSDIISRPKCILWLGSSLGNFERNEASIFLQKFSKILQPADLMLIGVDGTCNGDKILRFILNGLLHANNILGKVVFELSDWRVIGEYIHDDDGGRHQAFCVPKRELQFEDIFIQEGERILIEKSLKYPDEEAAKLWKDSGLVENNRWSASSTTYSLYHLTRSDMIFHLDPAIYASSFIPSLEDWKATWAAWDLVTRVMVPKENLDERPIKLRNPIIFYLGHIPTFGDLQISKVTGKILDETLKFSVIFERGIDPDVENSEICHSHSKIPEKWPPVDKIWAYQNNVRSKIRSIQKSQFMTRSLARALWVSFEHELMHLETLLYVLLMSNCVRPPTRKVPDFASDAIKAKAKRVSNEWFEIPAQNFFIGFNDPEDDNSWEGHFGWDNEKPRRSIETSKFQAQARPISIEDVEPYFSGAKDIPASWVDKRLHDNCSLNQEHMTLSNGFNEKNGTPAHLWEFINGKYLRTVYGLVPLKYTLDWPVFASFNELDKCAKWMNGRIPTFEEARSIYSYVNSLNSKKSTSNFQRKTDFTGAQNNSTSLDESVECVFTDLNEANVGFKNWHPVPVTSQGNRLAGQAEMGGVWEWTSSQLSKYEGFEPMKLYPEFTADFFDGKHNIVLGGSWATHPRIAGRTSFINWYQRNYPYAWAGARLVRDL